MSKDYRAFSLWLDGVTGELVPRPALAGPTEVDVAVVGGGYTGLWTAYYLKKADPSLRIAILEKEIAGFGASGRNGGWCSSFFAASPGTIADEFGRDAAIAMQRAMFATVDEVGRVIADEGIDARYHKGGALTLATSTAQLPRLQDELDHEREWGFGESDYVYLTAAETAQRIRVEGCLGAMYSPHCACVDPARLARGLAEVVERLGVTIYEQTPALGLAPHEVPTPGGAVKAGVVVNALEGYVACLPGHARDMVPLYSVMIATEPLPQSFWDEVGWSGREVFGDERYLLIYCMRTQDDRIALGGRGAPYHFGSKIRDDYDLAPKVFGELHTVLRGLFPAVGEARITHTWGGCLGVPRDWFTSVGYDREKGMAWAGGYVGDGVSTTNLAGRTLAELIAGADHGLAGLPWVGHASPPWEPEPLRWLGVNLSLYMMGSADRVEARTGRPSKRADLTARLIGR
ncbi:MAG: FAD-dependent oxidoreductase [Thermoleophilia bacterium]